MSLHLDPPIRVAGRFLSVVSDVDVTLKQRGRTMIGHGHKQPRMILLLEGGMLTALDMEGRRVPRSKVDDALVWAMERLVANWDPS